MPKLKAGLRTLTLGFVAVLALLFGLLSVMELPLREVAQLLVASVLIVAVLALAGFIVALIWRASVALFRSGSSKKPRPGSSKKRRENL